MYIEAIVARWHKGVAVKATVVDSISTREFKYFHLLTLVFGREWGTECLKARFPLSTFVCVGYSVKLIYLLW